MNKIVREKISWKDLCTKTKKLGVHPAHYKTVSSDRNIDLSNL